MVDILTPSPVTDDLVEQLLNRIGTLIPGPFIDDEDAASNGVPIGGLYFIGGAIYKRLE